MKSSEIWHRTVRLLALLLAGIGLVAFENRSLKNVRRLKATIAENAAITQRANDRIANFSRAIAQLDEELARCRRLPIEFAEDEDALRAALDQCALRGGVTHAVYAVSQTGESAERVTFDVVCSSSEQAAMEFLFELCRRKELFFIDNVALRNDDGSVEMELRVTAFLKQDLPHDE